MHCHGYSEAKQHENDQQCPRHSGFVAAGKFTHAIKPGIGSCVEWVPGEVSRHITRQGGDG